MSDQWSDPMSDPTAPDPFCPVHGPARASDQAPAGCTCRVAAREEPGLVTRYGSDLSAVVEQHQRDRGYVPPAPSPDAAALVQALLREANTPLPITGEITRQLAPILTPLQGLMREAAEALAAPARRDEGEPIESLMPDADELRVEETLRGYLQGLRTAIHRPGTKTVEVERRIDEIVELVLGLLRQSRAAESAAFARGRAEGVAEQRKMLCRLERMIRAESEDVTYGGFPGGDPREFACDPECSTEEERAAHAADCAAWDAWEAAGKQGDPPAPSVKHGREIKQLGDGSVMSVKYAGYGLGTCRWVDYDRRALADELAAAIRALGPQAAGTGEGKE